MEFLDLPFVGNSTDRQGRVFIPTGSRLAAEFRKNKATPLTALKACTTVFSSSSSRKQTDIQMDSPHLPLGIGSSEIPIASSIYHKKTVGDAFKGKSAVYKEKIQQIESFLSVNCARHVAEPQRGNNIRKALDDLSRLEPSISGIILSVRRYLNELLTTTESTQESLRSEIRNVEERTFKKCEDIFENRFLQLLKDKRKAETTIKSLRDEVLKLRIERDVTLMKAKEDVMIRLNDCERKEDEFRSFRKLISSVFKTNEGLVNRVEDLEALLRKHRIEIPRVNDDLYAYNKPRGEAKSSRRDSDGVRKIGEQVSLDFMYASREEMDLARLSLQRELLNSAFDDRTAYRLQVNGLRHENSELQTQIDALQNQIIGLERYIHEKRFLFSTRDGGEAPLTPRPRDVPFTIQTDLGIDLRNSTARIVVELAALGTNLKHQLNSAVMTLRQLSSAVDWMEDETMLKIADEANVRGALPTFPTSAWANIPHFLRTHVEPDVPNLRWSETDIAFLLFGFFSNYSSLKAACRTTRDSKMLAPRQYKLFERCENPMVRLDASLTELQRDENSVPFGYVMSYFVSNVLLVNVADSPYSSLIQPGTLNPSFSIDGKNASVEMELTKYSYNIWYAAQRYKEQQPLCRLFADVVDGRLPVEIFDVMKHVLRIVEARIRKFDTDGSGSFTYNKLVSSVLKLVADMDVQVGRCAILAVMETFKANQTPLVGGRIFLPSIFADESAPKKKDVPRNTSNRSAVSTRSTRSYVDREPQGASVFTRFWRRLVIQRYERVYSLMERILGPLVLESKVVIGLFLLPIPTAFQAVRDFDTQCGNMTEEEFNLKYPLLSEKVISVGGKSLLPSEVKGDVSRCTDEYGKLLTRNKTTLRDIISLEEVLNTTLESVSLLSRSMHFPAHEEERSEPQEKSTDAPVLEKPINSPVNTTGLKKEFSPKRKRGKTKANAKSKAKVATPDGKKEPVQEKSVLEEPVRDIIPSEMTVRSDKEMAEWYGFCATLRQSVLKFPEAIFSDGIFQGERVHFSGRSTDVSGSLDEELSADKSS
ncbi:hypothetical protein C3747_22g345 [Trypanosoma cruzi]|uniref:EF-hand domain-containing protein n=3 Tax=Trypanosoma cruzi TaxID=5693 RepID=Q4CRN9_TRYCC|nr:hypothetical protein, conserved [Trypanosoma cruzi]AAL88737.1 Tcc2i18.6 [Trypanosoma cruzi]EAN82941.1 hypothetical protein, conserved [Trypanosoma cruzi]PWV16561.1 hypothetical protein C3747_22g345 [Trypanosoma cruzi]|eukprot:XP_804792.1 hypothetical protein [Trypanosoma cruzi strain CL Brener]